MGNLIMFAFVFFFFFAVLGMALFSDVMVGRPASN